MKALFLIFHGFNPANGISKKIGYQVNALKACGVKTELCHLYEPYDPIRLDTKKLRMVDATIIHDYGFGFKSKLLKRIEFRSITKYVLKEKIDFVYMRSDHNANPFTIHMVRSMRNAGVKIVMEIPTYPYDQEYIDSSHKHILLIDKCFRFIMAKQLNNIVTFSDYDTIFGIPTIRISNGIDFSQIKLKQNINDTSNQLHLIGVAEIHYWHGFDRLIKGLANYYKTKPTYKVHFHIVGAFFSEREKSDILPLISQHNLENYVTLHGAKHGEELDSLFENADMAIGSLARHRSGITNIKTLKNREYAARGLSFIYSETDHDFEDKPYIMKVPADESSIDIEQLIRFYRKQKLTPQEIRDSISHLSWKEQMKKVIDQL